MILVTGASGTVGTALVEVLKNSHRFRAGYHSPGKAEKARQNGLDAIAIDLMAPETLAPALAGVETVFLLGAGIRGQVEQEINLIDAARAAGVRRLVKISAWRAGAEQYALARLHRQIEDAVEKSGMAWTFLRPNGFMQNFTGRTAETIKGQGAIYLPAADAQISLIDARDIARVAAKVLTEPGHEGNAYDLSGPRGLSYGDTARILSRQLGRDIKYIPVTDDAAREGMIRAGMPDFYADALIDLFRAYRNGMASGVTSSVKSITGHEPIMFDQFVRDHADAFR